LAVKLTPQGPDQAVLVAVVPTSHGSPGGAIGVSTTSDSGWPDSIRE
jgi:hypothetical protein